MQGLNEKTELKEAVKALVWCLSRSKHRIKGCHYDYLKYLPMQYLPKTTSLSFLSKITQPSSSSKSGQRRINLCASGVQRKERWILLRAQVTREVFSGGRKILFQKYKICVLLGGPIIRNGCSQGQFPGENSSFLTVNCHWKENWRAEVKEKWL